MTHYISRIRLSKSPAVSALSGLLAPKDGSRRMAAAHNLLWAAFADGPDRTRDFLWREDRDGAYLALSERPPIDTEIFEPHVVKAFDPDFRAGDRLEFTLRANATRMKTADGKRVDVVMDALSAVPRTERAGLRMKIAEDEGTAWMRRQGEKSGFKALRVDVEDYRTEALPDHRGPRKGRPQFGILDMTGVLEVRDPLAFRSAVLGGLGRAKSFGCGLMLLRRAAA
jgi:CRISPR system Cascade subunit CasE